MFSYHISSLMMRRLPVSYNYQTCLDLVDIFQTKTLNLQYNSIIYQIYDYVYQNNSTFQHHICTNCWFFLNAILLRNVPKINVD